VGKKVLIIINEGKRGDMGLIPDNLVPEIQNGTCHVSKLIDQVSALPGVEKVETIFYADVTPQAIEELDPDAVIGSGRDKGCPLSDIPAVYKGVFDFLRGDTRYPYLGVCFGHHLLGMAFGGAAARINEDLKTSELGYHSIRSLAYDSLLRDLKTPIRCMELHYNELKSAPGFKLFASTDTCPIQGIRHPAQPLWGVQFHPEYYSAEYPDGKIILENFLGLR